LPGVDSRVTVPPRKAAAFLTRARPIGDEHLLTTSQAVLDDRQDGIDDVRALSLPKRAFAGGMIGGSSGITKILKTTTYCDQADFLVGEANGNSPRIVGEK